jgi:hypothetical protein
MDIKEQIQLAGDLTVETVLTPVEMIIFLVTDSIYHTLIMQQ